MPASIQFKPIKAKKYNQAAVLAEVVKELEREGDIELRMFEKTTRTWKKKPKFYKRVSRVGSLFYLSVGTDNDIYGYLNEGVKARIITAKRKPYLVFKWPYGAKTKVRTIGSGRGSTGKNWAKKKSVRWKGIKARRFAEEIERRRKPYFAKNIQKAMDRGLSKLQ